VSAWLIDKSAISRLHLDPHATEWASRIERGLVRICTVTLLEIGYSARSASDHRSLLDEPPVTSMPIEYLTPKIEDRALELQRVLSDPDIAAGLRSGWWGSVGCWGVSVGASRAAVGPR